MTTSVNSMTRRGRPHRHDHRGPRPQGPLRHRSGLRLPVPPGVHRRRHHLDEPRRHRRRGAVHPRRQRPPAISGSSGGEWLDVHVDLDASPAAHRLRFLYRTDGGVAPDGFFADEIVVSARRCPGRHQRRRGRRRGLGARRLHVDHRDGDRRLRELLHRVAPQLRVLRQVPEDRSVQLRLRQHEAGLRGALQLHAGPAHLVLGHLPGRQQHQRAPGPGADPADRLPPRGRSTT